MTGRNVCDDPILSNDPHIIDKVLEEGRRGAPLLPRRVFLPSALPCGGRRRRAGILLTRCAVDGHSAIHQVSPRGPLWWPVVAAIDECCWRGGVGEGLGVCAAGGAVLCLDGGVGQVLAHPLYPNLDAVWRVERTLLYHRFLCWPSISNNWWLREKIHYWLPQTIDSWVYFHKITESLTFNGKKVLGSEISLYHGTMRSSLWEIIVCTGLFLFIFFNINFSLLFSWPITQLLQFPGS